MHVLRPFVEETSGLISFVSSVMSNPVAQGVVLDVNPFWFEAYRLARVGLSPNALEGPWPYRSLRDSLLVDTSDDLIDFGWSDDTGWVEKSTRRFFAGSSQRTLLNLSLIVKVIAKPVDSKLAGQRASLVSLAASQTSFLAIVETRPLGRLALASGDSCLAGGYLPGTIGGFLRDGGSGAIFATTCGHVATIGANVSVAGNYIGSCLRSNAPVPLQNGAHCTPACPSANKLDLALIDIGGATVSNTVTGVATSLSSRQRITLRGGKSGVHAYETGGLVITYSPGASNVCFENMFEVRPLSPGGILNQRVRNIWASVPTQGDSGSWIETGSTPEWCGVLVAADGLMGYALEASDVLNEANTAFGMQLQLV